MSIPVQIEQGEPLLCCFISDVTVAYFSSSFFSFPFYTDASGTFHRPKGNEAILDSSSLSMTSNSSKESIQIPLTAIGTRSVFSHMFRQSQSGVQRWTPSKPYEPVLLGSRNGARAAGAWLLR